MFKCAVTKRTTRPGEKMNRVVVETRPKVYTEWIKEDGIWTEIEVGRGYETVKEIPVSDAGLRMLEEMDDERRKAFLKGMR